MITGIIGARLYFCFFKWDYYGQNPIEILYINNGGLAIYGGIIGALLGGLTVAKYRKWKSCLFLTSQWSVSLSDRE